MQLSQKNSQTPIRKDNSTNNTVMKEKDRPITVGAKASGVEVTQGNLDLSIWMPWTQALPHEKFTLKKKSSTIKKKGDALNEQKLDISHNSVLTDRKPCIKTMTNLTLKKESIIPASIEEFTDGETLALAALKLNDEAREHS